MVTDANGNGPEIASYTCDELGVDQELRDLQQGRTFDYVTDDGTHFERVTLPVDGRGWGSEIVAAADGYTQFVGTSTAEASTTTVLHSADGHTWTRPAPSAGVPMSSGLLGGRPAVLPVDVRRAHRRAGAAARRHLVPSST